MIAFLSVAISSAGKLDGLGLEFTCWNPIGPKAATVSAVAGLLAGAVVAIIALGCHRPLGVESGWNRLLLAVILGPVVEEVVFRGYLMTAALRLARKLSKPKGGWLSIVGIALVFMLAHGGRPGITCIQLGCTALTGTVYGFVRLRQQSTVAAVLAHACYNLALYVSFWIGVSN